MQENRFCGGISKVDGGYIVLRLGAGSVAKDPHIYKSILGVLAAITMDSGERRIGEGLDVFIQRYTQEGKGQQ